MKTYWKGYVILFALVGMLSLITYHFVNEKAMPNMMNAVSPPITFHPPEPYQELKP